MEKRWTRAAEENKRLESVEPSYVLESYKDVEADCFTKNI